MKTIIKAFAVIVLCAAVAGAAEKGRKKTAEKTVTEDPAKKEFKQCDTNHDGFISLAEWKAGNKAESTFKAKDKNGDGKLNRDEFCAELPAAAQEVKKYDRKSADQHLRRLKKLLEDGLLTKDMYDRKVAECEANIEEKPETTTAPAGKKK
ncbi:MAG: EF-hand domain-containing protein [Verrucomicrobia bacterium]|nr:EF-hand domain-containing protein [Verrucomicrobiota bacterium]